MINFPENKKIILFDGFCNLCDSSVQFIIKKDTKDAFRFVSIQSDLGKSIFTYLNIDSSKIDSIILFYPGKYYYFKSQAAMHIAMQLGGIYSVFGIFRILPKSFTDLIYDFIAKNRYKWYGKKESCMMPTLDIKAKFLENPI